MGSAWKECCPVQYEHTRTSEEGQFLLAHRVPVVHFTKDGLQPMTIVVGAESRELHVTMERATNSLVLRPCVSPTKGERQIPPGTDGLHFTVLKRAVKILGGKPDVDYVEYVIKPKKSRSALELWFGHYAMSWEPDEKQFEDSVEFTQRNVALPDGGAIGIDSRGRLRNGTIWRQMGIVGEGARYTGASAADAQPFDGIINSGCFTPYSSH